MIVFDLRCDRGHIFEAWLASSAAYEEQRASGLLSCPMCGSADVGKAVMAPAVAPKANQRRSGGTGHERAKEPAEAQGVSTTPRVPVSGPFPPEARAEMHRLIEQVAKAQAAALEGSQWVGDGFAEQARAMHYGERDHAPIHGTASAEEARAMMDEGLPVAPLPLPVIPPDRRN